MTYPDYWFKRKNERRRGKDFWLHFIQVIGLVGWLLIFFSLIVIGMAKPELESIFDRLLDVKLRKTWDLEVAGYILYLMIAGLILSITGIVINSRRLRRKEDRISYNLILVGSVSIIGIFLYFYYF